MTNRLLNFNALDADIPWIPYKRRSGLEFMGGIKDITSNYQQDPVVDVVTMRGDFQVSIKTFLLGVFQFVLMPDSEDEWNFKLDPPPTPEEIQSKLEPFREVFQVTSEDTSHRLMFQDVTWRQKTKHKANDVPIESLILDFPVKTVRDNNKDWFVRAGAVDKLSVQGALTALITQQYQGSATGGHFSPSRGGDGPVTTMMVLSTLWKSIYGHVLPKPTLYKGFTPLYKDISLVFGWMGEKRKGSIRVLEPVLNPDGTPVMHKGKPKVTKKTVHVRTLPTQVDALQVYFECPKRILLIPEETEPFFCPIARVESNVAVRLYQTRPNGIRYAKEDWNHPLAPYYTKEQKDAPPATVPYSGKNCSPSYRHWHNLVVGGETRHPARAVGHYLNQRDKTFRSEGENPRLHFFAYAYKKAKMLTCREAVTPLNVPPDSETRAKFGNYMKRLVKVANTIAGGKYSILEKAIIRTHKNFCPEESAKKEEKGEDKKKDEKKDKDEIKGHEGPEVREMFWAETEPDFYDYQGQILSALREDEDVSPILLSWRNTLVQHTRRVFRHFLNPEARESRDPASVAWAESLMMRDLHGNGILSTLGLLPPEEEAEYQELRRKWKEERKKKSKKSKKRAA